MNGKQLKNSILQWAIQGKLVPQDPNDEPASVLLERIRAEKARLVKEKKIKKDKNESIIYRGDDNSYYEKFLATGEVKCIDDEIPFEIPKGWEWCRLKHMCSMQAGKNISASEIYDKKSVLHPYRCVGGNGLRGFTNTFNAEGHFAIIGRQGALCGCLNIESGKFYATEHAVVVNGFGIIPSLFIYYFFTALNLNQYATATAQPGLAVSNIVEVFIPLPPLPEQLRIVSKIEKLLPLVKTYEQAQNGLNELNASLNEQLRKSILQEAIQGKLVPQCSDEGTAQELLEQIKLEKQKLIKDGKLKKSALTDSVIFKGDDNKYYERINEQIVEVELPFEYPNSWIVLRLKDICQLTDGEKRNGKGICLDAKFLRGKSSATIIEKGRFVYAGDNIILVDGENSGEVFSIPQDGYMGSTFKQLWLSSVMWKPCILAFILFYKEALRNSKRGAAIPHLNKDLFYKLPIGIPPLSEQQRITCQINNLFQLIK
ncbi:MULTISPECIES: restriction endonuclease subunit S [Bacteroidaceae]|uniref:restriction endonuclease subunit S n=2 Tax=Bacteroidales TaxID=171549 RepID=UPI0018A04494|nr:MULTISPECIES: restriction endonuclease subunit S [Bacteroidaceae]MBV4354891.1 restriction endonuclease subunit S [Bacteroides uniformis]MCG5041734.1 restriction endonuclease subunit S [Bacteroides uniformis]MCS2231093.1 restriction endonuclease subunit S [Phocaeicola vulgatus]MCS2717874.1 restriction endonuclease subunit S [Bacteroides thetaiotaomicron]MCS2717895.1 restriction endonuclease subunit S [Bacteroides thetaiotaomicron]